MTYGHGLSSIAATLCLLALPLAAQPRPPLARVPLHIDEGRTVKLSGHRHPQAQPEYDSGMAPPETRLERMMLVLAPDAATGQALEAFLEAQRDPQSPEYRHSLSPADFGERFGVAPGDVDRVAGWLRSHGFSVETPAESRRLLIFS